MHGLSTETAVKMLAAAVLPIDDAKAESVRIRQESYEDAVRLFEATGNATAAAEMLDVEPVTVSIPAAD